MDALLRDTKTHLMDKKMVNEDYPSNNQSNGFQNLAVDDEGMPEVPVGYPNGNKQVIEVNGKRYIVIKELDNDADPANEEEDI